jgi:hypothetical protein
MAKQTAEQLYNERREDIARVMDWIECELDAHRCKAQAEPGDWGYAGDLGHVLEKLTQTLAFLSNREPEDIEKLLSESR